MGIPASTCPAATRPPSSWAGTTPTPTSATWPSTCRRRRGGGRQRQRGHGPGAHPGQHGRRAGRHRHRRARPGALAASRIREIHVLGRRGPAQASFTNKELKELGELPGVDVVVNPAQLALGPESRRAWRAAPDRTRDEPGDPARLRRARADRGAAPDLAPLPRLAGGDPRQRARRGPGVAHNALYESETGTLRPSPPSAAPRCPPGWSSAPSATRGCRCRGSPSTPWRA